MSLPDALIGSTGFVGSNLAEQLRFDAYFRRATVEQMSGREFGLVVCAGVQAKKWWANQNPEEDWAGIRKLLCVLETVRAERFVLISTVDVYPDPNGVDEESPIEAERNHAYGRHRYRVEEFIEERFGVHHIIRLPGLFGKGLKKNVIYDLMHRHELEKINPAGVYQYYSLSRLGEDVQRVMAQNLRRVNFATEPIATRKILSKFFPDRVVGPEVPFQAAYDMRTRYGELWQSQIPGYLYSRDDVLQDLGDFLGPRPSGGGGEVA